MAPKQINPDVAHPVGFGRWGYAAVLIVVIVAVLPVVLSLKQVNDGIQLKNVTAYTQSSYEPEDDVLCPGDTLIFTPTLHVTLAPVQVEVSSAWWDEDHSRTAVQGKKGDTSISIFRENKDVTRAISVPVPNLAPGNYSYLRSTESSSGSRPGITSVWVNIPEGCPSASTGP